MTTKGSLRFLFYRFSAFIFDMLTLSFLITIISYSATPIVNIFNLNTEFLSIIHELSQQDSAIRSLIYLFIIAFYYGFYMVIGKNTLGLWVTNQTVLIKVSKPSGERDSEDEEKKVILLSKKERGFNGLTYLAFQMINITILGAFTFFAAFKEGTKLPLHERLSGVVIVHRKDVS